MKWEADRLRPERDEPEHVLVFGADAPFTRLTAAVPQPDESFPGRADPVRCAGPARVGTAAGGRSGRTAVIGDSFDLLGELPQGTTVLEASAGTGKTFTIAGLVTRYVAEGVARLDELLVVTFGRAATQELRDRVRERLVTARDGLGDPSPRRAAATTNCCAISRTGSDADVAQQANSAGRRARVRSTPPRSSTTHRFCQQVLIGLGTAGDVDAGAILVENLDDLVTEVVQDLYLRKWGQGDVAIPPMTLSDAEELALAVVQDGQAMLVPEADGPTKACRRSVPVRAGRARRGGPAQADAPHPGLRRPAHPTAEDARRTPGPGRRPRRGCAAATGSCSSTSSRTPTRCSGTSCGSPSTAPRRSC